MSKLLRSLASLFVVATATGVWAQGGQPVPQAPAGSASAPILRADPQTLDALAQRLHRLKASGMAPSHYPLAKAQCWWATAHTQYSENDRSGYVEEALQESGRIIQALEADRNAVVGFETPLIARSPRLRDDLWARFAQYKAQASTLACTGASVACGEVRLVRAGHAQQQIGWRTANVHIDMAEDALQRAEAEALRCAPVTPPPPPAVPAPVPAPPKAPAPERFTLEGDALFVFGESGLADILPAGQERLRALAQSLKAYRSIDRIRIVGHTDRIGSDAFNDRLSLARAATVKEKLQGLGVQAPVFDIEGMGKREPVTSGCSPTLTRPALIACLQPDRRVTVEITGIK